MYESKVKYYYGTGRRKHSVARVRLYPGNGTITINGRGIDDYFGLDTLKLIVRQPMEITNTLSRFDIVCTVAGGGVSGQAGAIRHGIARALLQADAEQYRPALKAAGFLTRRLAETGGCVQIVNLFLTPIEPTLKYLTEAKNGTKMGSSQIVFSGTADQWMEPELLADFCRKHGIEHHAYAGGNHSIETGHVLRDVEIAKEIVGFYEKLL